jgi:hypothetical protein
MATSGTESRIGWASFITALSIEVMGKIRGAGGTDKTLW